ncbi:MAG TPA: hypothetical protein VI548_08185 [Chitinophagaceae bacterium]|nr:hypothetical protein [Chitinophagaceae bacterium]
MQKIILIPVLLFISLTGFTQLNLSLFVNATPPGTLSEWGNRKEVLTYLVNYRSSGASLQVKIKTEIKLNDGTVAATTDLVNARVIALADGNNLFSATEVLALETILFNGKYKTTFHATGKLPSDNYQLCVTLVNPVDFTPIGEQRCRNFYLAALQLPITVMPANEMVLPQEKAQSAIIFRWTPVLPRPSVPVVYHIQVFQVLPGQKPMQAFRSNLPVLNKAVTGTTQYIWQPQLSMLPFLQTTDSSSNNADGLMFIWTIQATDAAGNPLSDGNINSDGRSEPSVFYIRHSGENSSLQTKKGNKY